MNSVRMTLEMAADSEKPASSVQCVTSVKFPL